MSRLLPNLLCAAAIAKYKDQSDVFRFFGWLKVLTALIVVFTTQQLSAAEVVKTLPTNKDYQPDFKIEECAGIWGIGTFNYENINAISDFCLDEEEGKISSAETRSGFQLVTKLKRSRAYEVIESGRDQYTRLRLDMIADSVWFENCNADDSFRLEYNVPDDKSTSYPGSGYASFNGHTLPSITSQPLNPVSNNVYLSLRHFNQGGLSKSVADNSQLPAGADFSGSLSFEDQRASLQVDSGLGHFAGDASGTLDLELKNDKSWQGRGTFVSRSARLVGHKPNEWVSMSFEVSYMRGFVVGDDGKQLVAHGLAYGTYKDARGVEHEFNASATLDACFVADK